MAYEI